MTLVDQRLIRAVAPLNNRYREASSARGKLAALWDLGDELVKSGITQPHKAGWDIQRATSELIKRPTIFRAHKIRSIWPSKSSLLADLGGIKHLSNLVEMFPLVDPNQAVRSRLSPSDLSDLFRNACAETPTTFRRRLRLLKRRFAHGRLGQRLDKARHLGGLAALAQSFEHLRQGLLAAMEGSDPGARRMLRRSISDNDCLALANICISLTTKANYRLYRRLKGTAAATGMALFDAVYLGFLQTAEGTEAERARLRRLISADALAQLADILSSLRTEALVDDYRSRKRLAVDLRLGD
jgi:hypothetical protein